MDKTDNLPTIMFNFNRVELKSMMSKLLDHLKTAQYNKCFGTPEATKATQRENARRDAVFERQKAHYEAQMKLKANDEVGMFFIA